MATLRKHLRSGYTTIPNEALRDQRLSFKATGILAVLLSHSDGWNISSASLARAKLDGLSAVRSGYTELCAAGYMKREQINGDKGRIETVIHVSDTAMPEWESHDSDPGSFDEPPLAASTSGVCPPIEEQGEKEQLKDQRSRSTPTSGKPDGETSHDDAEPAPPGAGLAVSNPPAKVADETRIATAVFDAWVQATGRNAKTVKLNGARRTKVRARLREGYTETDLVAAVRGIAVSGFHRGENDRGTRYDTIEVALRDGAQVEKFRDLAANGPERPADVVDQAFTLLDGMGVQFDDDDPLASPAIGSGVIDTTARGDR